MNVSLTPRLEKFVEKNVKAGMYQTASEVVRDGLRMLEERQRSQKSRLEELKKEIALGIEQANHGDSAPFSAAEIKREGRRLLAARRRRSR